MLQLPFSPAIDESLPNLFREETIQSVVSYAKTKPAGSHQLLLKVYPPTFAIVTVNENKQVSLHVVNHDEDPNYPNNLEMASATGFNWHREREFLKAFRPIHSINSKDCILLRATKSTNVLSNIMVSVNVFVLDPLITKMEFLYYISVMYLQLSYVRYKEKTSQKY